MLVTAGSPGAQLYVPVRRKVTTRQEAAQASRKRFPRKPAVDEGSTFENAGASVVGSSWTACTFARGSLLGLFLWSPQKAHMRPRPSTARSRFHAPQARLVTIDVRSLALPLTEQQPPRQT